MSSSSSSSSSPHSHSVSFAVIGDFGANNFHERRVSDLVHRLNPQFIVAVGDVNYQTGDPAQLDENVAQYYHDFMLPLKTNPKYEGRYATENKFYPCPGNHDWQIGTLSHFRSYFAAYSSPSATYYPAVDGSSYHIRLEGLIDLFSIDSGASESTAPDAESPTAKWLYDELDARQGDDTWKIVFTHFPPYSSGHRGSTPNMRWNFEAHGVHAVLAGHEHVYERIMNPGSNVTYFVNGLGGCCHHEFGEILPSGSVVRYNAGHGAQSVHANSTHMTFTFINADGEHIDEYTIVKESTKKKLAPTMVTTTKEGRGVTEVMDINTNIIKGNANFSITRTSNVYVTSSDLALSDPTTTYVLFSALTVVLLFSFLVMVRRMTKQKGSFVSLFGSSPSLHSSTSDSSAHSESSSLSFHLSVFLLFLSSFVSALTSLLVRLSGSVSSSSSASIPWYYIAFSRFSVQAMLAAVLIYVAQLRVKGKDKKGDYDSSSSLTSLSSSYLSAFPFRVLHFFPGSLTPVDSAWLCARGFVGSVSVLCFYFTLLNLSLGAATVLLFSAPIMTAFISNYVSGEDKLSVAHVVGAIMSMVGVICVERPGVNEWTWMRAFCVTIGLFGALCNASVFILVRKVSSQVHSMVQVLYLGVIGSLLCLLIIIVSWLSWLINSGTSLLSFSFIVSMFSISWSQLMQLFLSGVTGFAGQVFMNAGTKGAGANVSAMMRQLGIVWAFVIQFFLGDPVHVSSVVGALLIVAATILVLDSKTRVATHRDASTIARPLLLLLPVAGCALILIPPLTNSSTWQLKTEHNNAARSGHERMPFQSFVVDYASMDEQQAVIFRGDDSENEQRRAFAAASKQEAVHDKHESLVHQRYSQSSLFNSSSSLLHYSRHSILHLPHYFLQRQDEIKFAPPKHEHQQHQHMDNVKNLTRLLHTDGLQRCMAVMVPMRFLVDADGDAEGDAHKSIRSRLRRTPLFKYFLPSFLKTAVLLSPDLYQLQQTYYDDVLHRTSSSSNSHVPVYKFHFLLQLSWDADDTVLESSLGGRRAVEAEIYHQIQDEVAAWQANYEPNEQTEPLKSRLLLRSGARVESMLQAMTNREVKAVQGLVEDALSDSGHVSHSQSRLAHRQSHVKFSFHTLEVASYTFRRTSSASAVSNLTFHYNVLSQHAHAAGCDSYTIAGDDYRYTTAIYDANNCRQAKSASSGPSLSLDDDTSKLQAHATSNPCCRSFHWPTCLLSPLESAFPVRGNGMSGLNEVTLSEETRGFALNNHATRVHAESFSLFYPSLIKDWRKATDIVHYDMLPRYPRFLYQDLELPSSVSSDRIPSQPDSDDEIWDEEWSSSPSTWSWESDSSLVNYGINVAVAKLYTTFDSLFIVHMPSPNTKNKNDGILVSDNEAGGVWNGLSMTTEKNKGVNATKKDTKQDAPATSSTGIRYKLSKQRYAVRYPLMRATIGHHHEWLWRKINALLYLLKSADMSLESMTGLARDRFRVCSERLAHDDVDLPSHYLQLRAFLECVPASLNPIAVLLIESHDNPLAAQSHYKYLISLLEQASLMLTDASIRDLGHYKNQKAGEDDSKQVDAFNRIQILKTAGNHLMQLVTPFTRQLADRLAGVRHRETIMTPFVPPSLLDLETVLPHVSSNSPSALFARSATAFSPRFPFVYRVTGLPVPSSELVSQVDIDGTALPRCFPEECIHARSESRDFYRAEYYASMLQSVVSHALFAPSERYRDESARAHEIDLLTKYLSDPGWTATKLLEPSYEARIGERPWTSDMESSYFSCAPFPSPLRWSLRTAVFKDAMQERMQVSFDREAAYKENWEMYFATARYTIYMHYLFQLSLADGTTISKTIRVPRSYLLRIPAQLCSLTQSSAYTCAPSSTSSSSSSSSCTFRPLVSPVLVFGNYLFDPAYLLTVQRVWYESSEFGSVPLLIIDDVTGADRQRIDREIAEWLNEAEQREHEAAHPGVPFEKTVDATHDHAVDLDLLFSSPQQLKYTSEAQTAKVDLSPRFMTGSRFTIESTFISVLLEHASRVISTKLGLILDTDHVIMFISSHGFRASHDVLQFQNVRRGMEAAYRQEQLECDAERRGRTDQSVMKAASTSLLTSKAANTYPDVAVGLDANANANANADANRLVDPLSMSGYRIAMVVNQLSHYLPELALPIAPERMSPDVDAALLTRSVVYNMNKETEKDNVLNEKFNLDPSDDRVYYATLPDRLLQYSFPCPIVQLFGLHDERRENIMIASSKYILPLIIRRLLVQRYYLHQVEHESPSSSSSSPSTSISTLGLPSGFRAWWRSFSASSHGQNAVDAIVDTWSSVMLKSMIEIWSGIRNAMLDRFKKNVKTDQRQDLSMAWTSNSKRFSVRDEWHAKTVWNATKADDDADFHRLRVFSAVDMTAPFVYDIRCNLVSTDCLMVFLSVYRAAVSLSRPRSVASMLMIRFCVGSFPVFSESEPELVTRSIYYGDGWACEPLYPTPSVAAAAAADSAHSQNGVDVFSSFTGFSGAHYLEEKERLIHLMYSREGDDIHKLFAFDMVLTHPLAQCVRHLQRINNVEHDLGRRRTRGLHPWMTLTDHKQFTERVERALFRPEWITSRKLRALGLHNATLPPKRRMATCW